MFHQNYNHAILHYFFLLNLISFFIKGNILYGKYKFSNGNKTLYLLLCRGLDFTKQ